MHTKAIVRKPGRNFADGITISGLGRPDCRKALEQHEAYCNALARCGLDLILLEADDRYPDGCFVEDTAIVMAEAAVLTRPGAESRRGEVEEIARILSGYKTTVMIEPPGTLDGGDVMRAGGHFYIGISGRTNREGARQLRTILSEYNYTSSEVYVTEGLHLKSDIAYLGNGNFIATPQFSVLVSPAACIILEPGESYSANCLHVNEFLLVPKGYPKSKKALTSLGYNIIELEMSEFRKMDGGLTCLSLLL